jgi:hypothetical protein
LEDDDSESDDATELVARIHNDTAGEDDYESDDTNELVARIHNDAAGDGEEEVVASWEGGSALRFGENGDGHAADKQDAEDHIKTDDPEDLIMDDEGIDDDDVHAQKMTRHKRKEGAH